MWRGILASQPAGDFTITWEEHTENLGDDGVRRETIESFDGIRGVLMPSINGQVLGKNGYYVNDNAYFIVPFTELEERDIVPSAKTSYIRENGTLWRVVAVNDLSTFKQSNVYYMELKKMEVS